MISCSDALENLQECKVDRLSIYLLSYVLKFYFDTKIASVKNLQISNTECNGDKITNPNII